MSWALLQTSRARFAEGPIFKGVSFLTFLDEINSIWGGGGLVSQNNYEQILAVVTKLSGVVLEIRPESIFIGRGKGQQHLDVAWRALMREFQRRGVLSIAICADSSPLHDRTAETLSEWVSFKARPGPRSFVYDVETSKLYPKKQADLLRRSLYTAANAGGFDLGRIIELAKQDVYPLDAECVVTHLLGASDETLMAIFSNVRGARVLHLQHGTTMRTFTTTPGAENALAAYKTIFGDDVPAPGEALRRLHK